LLIIVLQFSGDTRSYISRYLPYWLKVI
jgi:hypothetical protein